MANEYLQRTPTSTGNRSLFTFSAWVKQNNPAGTNQYLFGAFSNGNNSGYQNTIALSDSEDRASYFQNTNSVVNSHYKSVNLYRDAGNWLHILIAVDSSEGQGVDRAKIYINGARNKNTSIPTLTSEGHQASFNSTVQHMIGNWPGLSTDALSQLFDVFWVDGQALTPDVFGFYKQGKGYISVGSTQATDFRPGQWVPKTPRVIKSEINRKGGFGVNGFYLPMNDSSNFGADFHCDPNSIITLNEKLPQPRVGVATTASVGLGYTDALRADPYAANLVLALPFVSGGLSSGFGDYAPSIKGSGSPKTMSSGSVSIASTASYYGTSANYQNANSYVDTPGTSGDFNMGTGDFTIEGWFYPTGNGGNARLFGQNTNTSNAWDVYINGSSSSGQLWMMGGAYQLTSASIQGNQWNHVAISRKNLVWTTYINGVAAGIVTSIVNNTVGDSTYKFRVGQIGENAYGGVGYGFQGYIQDFRVYKGVAKYKGGFDVPKPYTPVGIGTWRAVPDTTANNFATMNAVVNSSNGTNESFSNGNLTVANGEFYISTVGLTTGKWYWEYYESAYTNYAGYGIDGHAGSATTFASRTQLPGAPSGGQLYIAPGRSSGAQSFRGTAYDTIEVINITHPTITLPITSAGTVYAVALDLDSAQGIGSTGAVHFYINGTRINQQLALPTIYQGISTTGNVVTPFTYAAGTQNLNFGQNPTFSGNTTAGTYTDSNGKGLFKYEPPSGFLALCEDNLPTPAISDPGKHFKTVLYTGDGNSGRSITGIGFTPDLVWVKERNVAQDHVLHDSVRGAGYYILSNSTQQEAFNSAQITSFNSDGFTVGTSIATNENSKTFVAWCWRAGAGTTSTNTDGSIPSVVSVNQDAGFSIVSGLSGGFSGSVVDTFGHGLGKTPSFVLLKNRDIVDYFYAYHRSLPTDAYLQLGSTSAYGTSVNGWGGGPNSNVFGVKQSAFSSAANQKLIFYCWAEIEGFSKFGSYVGNLNADGPFVYCGFKPAWVLIKRNDSTGSWGIWNSSVDSTNPSFRYLLANDPGVEQTATTHALDFLSNGFKIRNNQTFTNTSGGTYIFAAFAESPFTTANAK